MWREEGARSRGVPPDGMEMQPMISSTQAQSHPVGRVVTTAAQPHLVSDWEVGFCDWWKHLDYCALSCCCPCLRLGLTVERARFGHTFGTVAGVFFLLYVFSSWRNATMGSETFDVEGGEVEVTFSRPPDPVESFLNNFASACFFLLCFLRFQIRYTLRRKYNIKGHACKDCCLTFWCSCCAITQEAVTVDMRELGHLPPGCNLVVWPQGSLAANQGPLSEDTVVGQPVTVPYAADSAV